MNRQAASFIGYLASLLLKTRYRFQERLSPSSLCRLVRLLWLGKHPHPYISHQGRIRMLCGEKYWYYVVCSEEK